MSGSRSAARSSVGSPPDGDLAEHGEVGVGQHGEREQLEREIAAWERARNAAGARVRWMFTTEKARTKMGRAYPAPASLDPPGKAS